MIKNILSSSVYVLFCIGCATTNYHAESLLNKDNEDIRTEVVSRYVGYIEGGSWEEKSEYCDDRRTRMVKFFKNNMGTWDRIKSTMSRGENELWQSRMIDRMTVLEVECEGGWQLLVNGYTPMTAPKVKVNPLTIKRLNETVQEYEDRMDAYEESLYKAEHKRRGTLPDDMKREPASSQEEY